jgi:site-specific DNA recombinase
LRDAKLARFDVLLVYRVDRLARSIRGLAQVIDELDQAGVIFRSATEPFDTGTPAGRMMVQMLGVFAEFERALIVERITAGLERKAARGGWCGGQRPFGLNLSADREHLEPNPAEAPLVPVIFDRYANHKMGSSALADWLNEHGHRTKNGRLWSKESLITVLRNRAYVGEIYYRGNWYPAPHERLIPTELFQKAQAILTERREDRSKRASNPAEYLLSGRIRCGRCGQAYVGTAAHGRNSRYTYYTCFTRARYGTKHCDNDRLPAEQLEQAVTRRLWKVLDNSDIINQAIEQTYTRISQRDETRQSELEAVQQKLDRTRAAINRYFQAFEDATMPEDTCAPRIAVLGEQVKALEDRAAELVSQQDDEQLERVSAADLQMLRDTLRVALADASHKHRKTVLQEMIDGIRVDARDHIEPTFRVPAVRIVSGYMEPAGIEPATSCL